MHATVRNPNEFIRSGFSKSVNKNFHSTKTLPSKFNTTMNLKPPIGSRYQPTVSNGFGSTNGGGFKFQTLSKLIVNKMDEVLQQPVQESTDELEEIKLEISNQSHSQNSNLNQVTAGKKAFLTDVELINQLKKDIFDDSFGDNESNGFRKKNTGDNDFRNLIKQVDTYKQNVKEEFDELQYLIKYVKDTKKKVGNHMAGVRNVFKESRVKKKTFGVDEKEHSFHSDDSYDNSYKKNIYNKEKHLNKVKDNLFNIQDKVISFHQNFSSKVNRIGEQNKAYKSINLVNKK